MGSTSESMYGAKLKQLINVGVHYITIIMMWKAVQKVEKIVA